jgi:hypothetical protein
LRARQLAGFIWDIARMSAAIRTRIELASFPFDCHIRCQTA